VCPRRRDPDGKTVCRFRLALVAADLPERLFAELDRQLEAKVCA
jgi:hypothetical protein